MWQASPELPVGDVDPVHPPDRLVLQAGVPQRPAMLHVAEPRVTLERSQASALQTWPRSRASGTSWGQCQAHVSTELGAG